MNKEDIDARFGRIVSELQRLPEPSRVHGYIRTNAAATLGAGTKALALMEAVSFRKDVFYEKLNKELEQPELARPCFCIAVINAARDHYVSGFDRMRESIVAEAFDDLLTMAEHLHTDGFHLAAVSICGGVLEDALRKLHAAHIGEIQGESRINALNDALKKHQVYPQPQFTEVKSWADLRNDVDHGRYSNSERLRTVDETGNPHRVIDPAAVARMIAGTRSLIANYLG